MPSRMETVTLVAATIFHHHFDTNKTHADGLPFLQPIPVNHEKNGNSEEIHRVGVVNKREVFLQG